MVSQGFVRKMYEDMLKTSDDKEKRMLASVNQLYSKCDKFAKIADHEFEGVQLVSKEACVQARRAKRALHIEIIRKKRLWRLKDLWRALRKNRAVQLRKRAVKAKLFDSLRRQHMAVFFKKWRIKAYHLKEINRKDSLKGAQLQLDHFKKQLMLFDRALEKIHEEKIGLNQLEKMKDKLEGSSSFKVFNDMKNLVDT